MRIQSHLARRRPWSTAWRWVMSLALITQSLAAKTASDYYVRSLPGQPEGPLLWMHAGLIEVVPEHHGNLFFWHFENRHLANRHRTVIWLNGGPGCSSLDGALMEIGPYRLQDDHTLKYNDGSWDEFANLLFVDNPLGTGYSYVDTDSFQHELPEMADTFMVFLEKYFELFPEHENDDLYIAGESYAGQHIPYVAKGILDHNAAPEKPKKWNLKGLLMGNAWISPREQSEAYLGFSYKEGLVKKGTEVGNTLDQHMEVCKNDMAKAMEANEPHVTYHNCESILTDMLYMTRKDGTCYNMYDIRLRDSHPSCGMNWPPDLEYVTPYLRRKDVISALHVDHDKTPGWTECNGQVGNAFRTPKSRPSVTFLPKILETVPVLLFSGREDLICNHLGTEEMIHNLQWSGGTGFEVAPGTWAPRRDWTFEGELAGMWQTARNLTYVLFYNSSHMVPFDYPRRTRDMLDRFMRVDIASIGGHPADSRIDGQKGLETSVGGHPNSTAAEQAEEKKIDDARWSAYYRSGAIALVVVAVLAVCFGWYVWRDRRQRAGYQGLKQSGAEGRLMAQHVAPRDVEAADFDENELDDLPPQGTHDERRYSIGGVSSDEEGDVGTQKDGKTAANGHTGAK